MKKGDETILSYSSCRRLLEDQVMKSKKGRLLYKDLIEEFNVAMPRAIKQGIFSVTISQYHVAEVLKQSAIKLFLLDLKSEGYQIMTRETAGLKDAKANFTHIVISL